MPQRESDAGALRKYFGKVAGEDEFKIRGIEARQRSTPKFVEDVQRDCLEILGRTQSPDAVISRLERAISDLHAGDVDPGRLVERNRVSKSVEAYTQYTQNVAALERARDQDLGCIPDKTSSTWWSTIRDHRETVSPLLTRSRDSMIHRTMRRN